MKYANQSAFPLLVCELDVPTRPDDLVARDHNKYVKEALFDACMRWHDSERGFKARFTREAKQRFHHFERSPKYAKTKSFKYHSSLDLVKTGASRESMRDRYQITMGGNAEKGTQRAQIKMRFAFKGGGGRFRNDDSGDQRKVTIEKMLFELTTCDAEDATIVAKRLAEGYRKRLDEHRKTRKRIRISAKK